MLNLHTNWSGVRICTLLILIPTHVRLSSLRTSKFMWIRRFFLSQRGNHLKWLPFG